ncbi:MAG: alpha-L-fucosidase [Bacteroidetes bacterium]|nr:alpha-L-fucosidase [Bacteroidota bacterium]
MKKALFVILSLLVVYCSQAQKKLPLPTKQQLAWHDMEFYWFIHFGPNTFTDKEWGHGDEPEDIFNPTELDCRQWARIAKQSGAKGIILTAKHHDGFCLFPSKNSTHTVRESKWMNGKGDVVGLLQKACKEYGLKFGVYLSPWDRNHPKYGTPEYNDVYVNTMTELITKYGPFFEFWWDGANGEGPNGKKQVYDFHRFEKTMRKLAPNTVVFSDIGPDIRWVGNENGIAGKTNWNYLDTAGFTRGAGGPSQDSLNQGNINGKNWIPAECDVSIRPGWFYHKEEDEKVKTPEQLFDLYLKSVGRGSTLLLNVPPDRRGLINEHDSASLIEFRKLREQNFSKSIVTKSFTGLPQTNVYIVKIAKPLTVNCVVVKEAIQSGQKVKSFTVRLKKSGEIVKEIEATTVGRKRILSFPVVEADAIELTVTDAKSKPSLTEISAYKIDDDLIEK